MVFWVTVVPTAFRSWINSSGVVLCRPTTFLMIILTPWPMRVTDGHFIFIPFPNYCTNSCQCQFHFIYIVFTKLLADGILAHSSLMQVYNLVPDVLWQLFDVAHGGEEVRTGVLYAHNELIHWFWFVCYIYASLSSRKVGGDQILISLNSMEINF